METIILIIERKKSGFDCTEAESAEIKMFVKETLLLPGSIEENLIEEIQILFPQEYAEAMDEVNSR